MNQKSPAHKSRRMLTGMAFLLTVVLNRVLSLDMSATDITHAAYVVLTLIFAFGLEDLARAILGNRVFAEIAPLVGELLSVDTPNTPTPEPPAEG